MRKRIKISNNEMVERLVFRLLPVQAMIVAMGSINTLVDGIVASRCISPSTVGVVGLYFSMLRIMEAIGAVVMGGTAFLCGRYMGRGEIEKTNGIFSLNLTITLMAGLVLTAVSAGMPGVTARVLGADPAIEKVLSSYVLGYSIGITPQLLSLQLAYFLQLERKSGRSYAAIAAMILVNAGLDILFVAIWKMDVWGLALASSISNWVYFLIVARCYFGKNSQLSFRPLKAAWRDLPVLLQVGFSGALMVFCLAVRAVVVNRILLKHSGSDGLSAMAVYNMIYLLFISLPLGMSAVIRMLTSVFVGEDDRDSILALIRIELTSVMAITLAIGAGVFVFSHHIAGLYFSDSSSEVFRLTRQLLAIFAVSIPLVMITACTSDYFQAVGHIAFVNVISFSDGFLAMVIPTLLLAPLLGATGVWIALFVSSVAVAMLEASYSALRCRRFCGHLPRKLDEWLLLPLIFRGEDDPRMTFTLREMQDISRVAEEAEGFCKMNGVDHRTAYYSALCLEEMTRIIILHGFEDAAQYGNGTAGRQAGEAESRRAAGAGLQHRAGKLLKKHTIQAVIVTRKENILLRIKDDCRPFNPLERAQLVSSEDPAAHIGIRMVLRLAEEVDYQNLLGLNVLTIRLPREHPPGCPR